jgi:hypothetical protein
MATLEILTEKDHYSPGETVHGNVLLQVTAKIKGPQGISLTFVGF